MILKLNMKHTVSTKELNWFAYVRECRADNANPLRYSEWNEYKEKVDKVISSLVA